MSSLKNTYPDVESVLDVIRTRDEMGLPLSPGSLHKGKYTDPNLHKAGIFHCETWQKAVERAGFNYHEILGKARLRYSTATSVIEEIQNRHKKNLPLVAVELKEKRGPNRDLSLYSAASRFFGNWRAAIEASGLDYEKIRRAGRRRRYPDGESVLAEIHRRYAAGFPLTSTKLTNKGSQSDPILLVEGKYYFGSWPAALATAGVDYKEIRGKTPCRFPDRATVVKEILRRERKGLPLNAMGLSKGEHRDSILYGSGQKHFGTWQLAVEAAGLDFNQVVRSRLSFGRRYPDADSIITEIQHRSKIGLSVNRSALTLPEKGDFALLKKGMEYFGSWPAAIKAAGLDYEKVRARPRRKYQDIEAVLEGIRNRSEKGLLMHALSVMKGEHRNSLLHLRACEYFHSWRTAVEAAGLDYDIIRRNEGLYLRKYPDRAAVTAEIKRRYDSGIPLNPWAVENGEYRNVTLLKAGRDFFGSWAAALEVAGIDPETIYKGALPKKNCWHG